MNYYEAIGADIGGSHITTMAVDLVAGTIIKESRARRDVNSTGPAAEILAAWKSCLEETMIRLKEDHLAGIGFAMPGPFDYPNGIALFRGVMKFDSLYGLNIRQSILELPGLPASLPVRFLNDATCFAIGEAWLGTGSGHERVMAITLGTGFGSAFLDNGIPVSAGDEVPQNGWVYHLPFGDSIADDHFSTRWFVRRYHELTGLTADGARELAIASGNDPVAKLIFNEFGRNLGKFLAPLIKRFRAGCLVVGGSISLGYELFKDPFIRELNIRGITGLQINVSTMGEDAAIAGSARLSDNDFYQAL